LSSGPSGEGNWVFYREAGKEKDQNKRKAVNRELKNMSFHSAIKGRL